MLNVNCYSVQETWGEEGFKYFNKNLINHSLMLQESQHANVQYRWI